MAEDSTRRSFGDDMLRPSPNHGTQRLPNDDDDIIFIIQDDIYNTTLSSLRPPCGRYRDGHHK